MIPGSPTGTGGSADEANHRSARGRRDRGVGGRSGADGGGAGTYNVVTAPKELLLAVETGPFTVPEPTASVDRWIDAQVGTKEPPSTAARRIV